MVADALLLRGGEQKMEAAAEAFGENLAPALNGAYQRLIGAEISKDPSISGEEAEVRAIKKLKKENLSTLKYIATNPVMVTTPISISINSRIKTYNKQKEQDAIQELRDQATQRNNPPPSALQEEKAKERASGKIDL